MIFSTEISGTDHVYPDGESVGYPECCRRYLTGLFPDVLQQSRNHWIPFAENTSCGSVFNKEKYFSFLISL